jgi:L-amino acid N-acyltransferase YncA
MNLIRLATAHDAFSILGIYAPYIVNTSYTFETEVPDLDSFKQRINLYLHNWPWLVCEIKGKIAGYAYGAKHRERIAYQWSVESSIYVDDDHQRAGVATALYTALIEILKLQGFRNVYAVINLPNEKSVAFHEKMGFEYFGTFKKVGYKLGRWKDVGWWQLHVNDYSIDPVPPIPFSKLDHEEVRKILESSSKLIRS